MIWVYLESKARGRKDKGGAWTVVAAGGQLLWRWLEVQGGSARRAVATDVLILTAPCASRAAGVLGREGEREREDR